VAAIAEDLADILRERGRNSEAKAYEDKAAAIRAKMKQKSRAGSQNEDTERQPHLTQRRKAAKITRQAKE
jgi:hypothetical protein